MGLEKEIVESLDLCAVLMSDPIMLEKYPDVVASQFTTARTKIEMLGVFLRKLDKGCGCHTKGWMDLSIISEGMGKLVVDALRKQLEVVQMKKFPVVVTRDFRVSGEVDSKDTVNYFEREIKETNCMSCVVLLYYYLYWFLFLIQMNKRIDPMYCTQKDLDIKWLLQHLPRSKDFLEFRYLGDAFNQSATITSLKASKATEKFMFSELDIEASHYRKRKTVLIAAYKRALDNVFKDESFSNPDVEFPACLKAKDPYFIYNTITAEVVAYGMSVMGGMASVFESQDPVQKWKDMHTEIIVRSFIDSKLTSVSSTLADVLSNPPYSASKTSWNEKGSKACLFDFCSAGLMMDVCRSFQMLVGLVHELFNDEGDFFRQIHTFLFSLSGNSDEKMVLQKILESNPVKKYVDLTQKQKMFISKSNTSVKSGDRMETYVLDYDGKKNVKEVSLWVDRFKSLYPSHNGFSTNDNHRCFLLVPSLESPEYYDSMIALQNVLIRSGSDIDSFFASSSLVLLSQLMQNSWMITRGITTAVMLIGKLLSTQGFRDVPFNSNNRRMQSNVGFYDILFSGVVNDLASDAELKSELPKIEDSQQAKFNNSLSFAESSFPVSFTDILELANRQQKTFNDLTRSLSSNTFKKYPSLVWPVWYNPVTGHKVNNLKFFHEIDETESNPEDNAADRAESSAKRAEISAAESLKAIKDTAKIYVAIVQSLQNSEASVPPSPLHPVDIQSAAPAAQAGH